MDHRAVEPIEQHVAGCGIARLRACNAAVHHAEVTFQPKPRASRGNLAIGVGLHDPAAHSRNPAPASSAAARSYL